MLSTRERLEMVARPKRKHHNVLVRSTLDGLRKSQVKRERYHNVTLPAFQSLDEMQQWAFSQLLSEGVHVSPRRLLTRELPPVHLVLLNPRRRILTSAIRRWSLPLALGEFCWHLSGSNEVAPIQYYSSRWQEFADDEGKIKGSCYGFQIFRPINGRSQWDEIKNLLRYDPSTRRAVLTMSQRLTDGDILAKDVACASSLQFLLRNGQLDAVLHMRSNDAFWGLPYDVFLFTMLQELLAAQLNVKLGTYYHSVASLHLYERHIDAAETILADTTHFELEMPRLSSFEGLSDFIAAERRLRMPESECESCIGTLPHYWRQLAEVLVWHSRVKKGADKSAALNAISEDSPYRKIITYLTKGTPAK